MDGVSNMQTIYVITKGSYSDYHICAATTDEKRAERLRDLFYNDGSMYPDDVYIEEFRDGTYNHMFAELSKNDKLILFDFGTVNTLGGDIMVLVDATNGKVICYSLGE